MAEGKDIAVEPEAKRMVADDISEPRSTWTVPQLKEFLGKRGAKVGGGDQAELYER